MNDGRTYGEEELLCELCGEETTERNGNGTPICMSCRRELRVIEAMQVDVNYFLKLFWRAYASQRDEVLAIAAAAEAAYQAANGRAPILTPIWYPLAIGSGVVIMADGGGAIGHCCRRLSQRAVPEMLDEKMKEKIEKAAINYYAARAKTISQDDHTAKAAAIRQWKDATVEAGLA